MFDKKDKTNEGTLSNAVKSEQPTVNLDQSGALSVRTKSQTEIDQEASMLRLEAEKIRLQTASLELEKLQHDIAAIRQKNAAQLMSASSVQESLAFSKEDRIRKETLCSHMKGGSSEEMLRGAPAQGNDTNNYAFITHSLTTGVTFRMCQRCGKTWFPGDPDYKWAITRPSRNSPSSGCPSPGLIRDHSLVRRVSEVEHRSKPVDSLREY